MTFTPATDVSLNELLSDSDHVSSVLISAPTLKSLVGAFVDALIEQQESSLIWAKLPRGETWQMELERFAYPGTVAPTAIYLFKAHQDDHPEEPGTVTGESLLASGLAGLDGSTGMGGRLLPLPIAQIELSPDSPLRRHYFLLIWSAHLQVLLLAQRSRPPRVVSSDGEMSVDSRYSDLPQDRRPQVMVSCSFQPAHIETVLRTLEQVLAQDSCPSDAAAVEPDVMTQWRSQMADLPICQAESRSLDSLLLHQLQRQEDLWSRSQSYRKSAENAEFLQLQNARLCSALQSKEEILTELEQELRTPLTMIKTALELLNSPNLKAPQRQRYMDLITQQCDRQTSLINSLLELIQVEQPPTVPEEMKPLRLCDVVPAVVSTYQPVTEEKGVRLAYTIPEELPQITCQSHWLRQIVLHLLNNAIKFTPQGGQVWVRAKQEGNFVQLEFRDTGVGIASSEIPKIFDRFYRVRQSGEDSAGSGLGLSIVQQLLIHCGGSISVKSKVGEGSTFLVLLPIHTTERQE